MKRLINDGDIFDKYANLEEKSLTSHPEEKLGSFNWYGMRHISGTYSGAAYTTSLADGYMATDLRSAANPRGSILKEAKNYTDQKVATIGGGKHTHYIGLTSPGAQIFFTYISEQAEKYTIETLKQVLNNRDKKIPCSGYWDARPVVCFFGYGNSFQLGTVQNKAISFVSEKFTSINDYVE
mgnify:CR=1 FL=1